MNHCEWRTSSKTSAPVEDNGFQLDFRPYQYTSCDLPGADRNCIAQADAGGSVERFRNRISASNSPDDLIGRTLPARQLGECGKIGLATFGVKIQPSLRKFGHFGNAASDCDTWHGVSSEILQHAADEVAHIDKCNIRQLVQGLNRGFRGFAGGSRDMYDPIALATSIPRRILSIHAAQEYGTTIPVVPRTDSPPMFPRRRFSVRCANAAPLGMDSSTTASLAAS